MTAQELKTFLEQWELSQTEASRLFGIKQQVVSDIVNGKRDRIPVYIQKSFLFFSLLPHKQQQKLINDAQANKVLQLTGKGGEENRLRPSLWPSQKPTQNRTNHQNVARS